MTTEAHNADIYNAGAAAPGACIQVSGLGLKGEWVQKNCMGGGASGERNFAFPVAHTQVDQTGTSGKMQTAEGDIRIQFALMQTETSTLNATISSGTLTVEIREIDMASPQATQTLSLDLQAETLPLPQATSLRSDSTNNRNLEAGACQAEAICAVRRWGGI
ncbi:MAG: hypothetical protein Fur0032_23470 [Terrimicrobiaceae bacterium]